jgi:trimeric autotransporter adhesin
VATGAQAVAVGVNAVGSSTNASALGFGSRATFANSTAVGAGAVTTAPNQMVFGTASNTYVAPGITSAASLAAQSGPANFVTSDAGGHLAVSNFGPSTITNITNNLASLNQSVAGISANLVGLNANVANLQHDVLRAFEGTAIAVAMGGQPLPWDKRFAITVNWGTFEGQNAMGVLAQYRINDNWVLNGAVGAGFTQGGVAGRAGVTFAW